jgi:hypothetical protein
VFGTDSPDPDRGLAGVERSRKLSIGRTRVIGVVSRRRDPRPTAKRDLDDALAIRPPRRPPSGRPPSGAISTGIIAPLSTIAFGNSCRRHLNS